MYSRNNVPSVFLHFETRDFLPRGIQRRPVTKFVDLEDDLLRLATTDRYLTSLASRACSERFRSMNSAMPLATEPISWMAAWVSGVSE